MRNFLLGFVVGLTVAGSVSVAKGLDETLEEMYGSIIVRLSQDAWELQECRQMAADLIIEQYKQNSNFSFDK